MRLGRHILHELGRLWYRKPFFFFFGDVAITSQETNKRLRHAARAATNARRQVMQEVMLRCGCCLSHCPPLFVTPGQIAKQGEDE
jgi:nucleotidyltransferase/DNA polymerase involved in DNA repair